MEVRAKRREPHSYAGAGSHRTRGASAGPLSPLAAHRVGLAGTFVLVPWRAERPAL